MLYRASQSHHAEAADQHIDRHREDEPREHGVQRAFAVGERVRGAGTEKAAENAAADKQRGK